jgi:hypothetical protein
MVPSPLRISISASATPNLPNPHQKGRPLIRPQRQNLRLFESRDVSPGTAFWCAPSCATPRWGSSNPRVVRGDSNTSELCERIPKIGCSQILRLIELRLGLRHSVGEMPSAIRHPARAGTGQHGTAAGDHHATPATFLCERIGYGQYLQMMQTFFIPPGMTNEIVCA